MPNSTVKAVSLKVWGSGGRRLSTEVGRRGAVSSPPPPPSLIVLKSMRTQANLAAELSFHDYDFSASKLEEKPRFCRSPNEFHFLLTGCRFGADIGSLNCPCWLSSIPQNILHHLARVGLLLTTPSHIPNSASA